ncbi:MAG TPA: M15 family metallopeptidase [Candidatus Paceibacterota bacterium]
MSELVADSSYKSLAEAIKGTQAPDSITESLALIDVEYLSFDGQLHRGQFVLHKELEKEVREIFSALLEMRFPIERAVPVVAYGWDDERSMADNNTSGFNYREIIALDTLSNHSFGRALDINPRLNPYHAYDGRVYPAGATLNPEALGTITANSPVVSLFKERGWKWLGDRARMPDYQHFEKPL